MFFCISLGFVIAWAPYAVVSFLFIFHKEPRYMAPEGFVLPALFAKSSHIYNPFIYFYFNKTFQRELRCLLLSSYHKLGGNRVGVHISTGHQAPHPIHIHLQERGCVQKKNFGLPPDRTHSRNKPKSKASHTSNSRVPVRQVFACWGSTSKNTPAVMDNQPAKDYQPVSIWALSQFLQGWRHRSSNPHCHQDKNLLLRGFITHFKELIRAHAADFLDYWV